MTRIKRGKTATQKRKKVLKHTKGFKWGRKSKERAAKEALLHAWSRAFAGRKEKKRVFRQLWQVKINAALKNEGLKYNQFINQLKKAGIGLDRKILAKLVEDQPKYWKQIIAKVKGVANEQ